MKTNRIGMKDETPHKSPDIPREAGERGRPIFWAPREPIKTFYEIDLDISASRLAGEETIRLRNTAVRPLGRLWLRWEPQKNANMAIETGKGDPGLRITDPEPDNPSPGSKILELEEPLEPGHGLVLRATFDSDLPEMVWGIHMLKEWHPRLWWGHPVHDDYAVTITKPQGSVVAPSSTTTQDDRFEARGVRRFGIVMGKGLEEIVGRVGGVEVSAIHRPKASVCARLLVETALDVVGFYEEKFDFYPQPFLRIVPGMPDPVGGFDFATGIVSVHGQEKYSARPKHFWQWIMAHEIGHQYWGEHVLEGCNPRWLSIGLGIYADREYARSRGLDPVHHTGMMRRYLEGVKEGLDTTVERPADQLAQIEYDHNNIVIHGKGYSIVSALETVLGHETFTRVYRRCLSEYAGKRLDARLFQQVCEEESCQDLDWFFSQWLRSNKVLAYRISGIERRKDRGKHRAVVSLERIGSLQMPITIEARFQDGSIQREVTDRLLKVNKILFNSHAELVEAIADPDNSLPLLTEAPRPSEQEVIRQIREMPWTGAGKEAHRLYQLALEGRLNHSSSWLKLALALYDGAFHEESLDAFAKTSETAEDDLLRIAGWVWQGHIQDILGHRQDALAYYRKADVEPFPGTMRHDQYGIVIDSVWVKERIKAPFKRKTTHRQ